MDIVHDDGWMDEYLAWKSALIWDSKEDLAFCSYR